MTQTAPQGFFSGTNNIDPTAKFPPFPPDFTGRLRIDACKGVTVRDGGYKAFIAELTVLTSNNDNVSVGSKHSWFQGLKEPGTAYPACVAFLYAALGLDANKHRAYIAENIKPKQEEWLNDAISEQKNVLAGGEVNLTTTQITTKIKKQPFTLHHFSPTAEAVAQADASLAGATAAP